MLILAQGNYFTGTGRLYLVGEYGKAHSMSTVVAVDLEPIGSSGFTVRDVRLPANAGVHTTF
tara:strand:- start:349 stop:534 length:186 start_codon:yes stop_codon:yes gene_type:complete